MFEIAELGSRVSKDEFDAQEPGLRVDLLNAQFDLRSAGYSVILLVMGDDRIACNEVIDVLHEWLDPRDLVTEVFAKPTDEERERPPYWRYWRGLPPRGKIGVIYGGWATYPLAARLREEIDDVELDRRIEHMRTFEEELAADGALIVKLWLHLPKKEQKRRLKRAKKDKKREWQVDSRDWELCEVHEEALELGERMILRTDRPHAVWHIVECSDDRYRDLAVGTILRDALTSRLTSREPRGAEAPEVSEPIGTVGALATVDLERRVERKDAKARIEELQARLNKLQRRARKKQLSTVLAFEGWDAAGKGGCIRRITRALPAADYRVIPIAAPTEEERAQHYLWRFWRHLPRAGRLRIFDRSWYGRVLVERVEGFARDAEWQRAYGEINDFEAQLAEHDVLVQKFWLHIDPDEQLARFEARAETPYKKYKITDEDYRNRGKWDQYVRAVDDMVARTNTSHAPWHLIAANDKPAARVEVLELLCEGLHAALKQR